jgi:hypothetical protein
LTPFAAFLGRPLTQKKEKLENCRISCQTFTEILRISEKVWYETHQYWLSKIEGISLKTEKPEVIPIQALIDPFKPKNTQISHATDPLMTMDVL